MSIGQVLYILMRRSWIIALTLICSLAVAGAILKLVPGRYDASATASIDPGNVNPIAGDGGSPAAFGIMQGNLIALVESQRVAPDVVRRLNLTSSPYSGRVRHLKSFGRENIEDWMAARSSRTSSRVSCGRTF